MTGLLFLLGRFEGTFIFAVIWAELRKQQWLLWGVSVTKERKEIKEEKGYEWRACHGLHIVLLLLSPINTPNVTTIMLATKQN